MAFWDKISTSGNVEDRRGSGIAIGGISSLVGLGIILLYSFLGGTDTNTLQQILSTVENSQVTRQDSSENIGINDGYKTFASKIIGSSNDLWTNVFAKQSEVYKKPTLVLFRSATKSGCGIATSAVGPHYCPIDQTIYLDETFFDELTNKFGAKGGDVAQAYVIAHEVGHHVQNQLGIMDEVQSRYGNSNTMSVKLELQADCYAGVWAYSVSQQGVFENENEINEAIDAAEAVGDDRIQKETTGRINPETWTHGSAQDRANWFNKGYKTGNPNSCNTFSS